MAQAPALHETELKAVADVNGKVEGEPHRSEPEFWDVNSGPPHDARPSPATKKKKDPVVYLAVAIAVAVNAAAIFYFWPEGPPSGKAKTAVPVAPGASLPGPLESQILDPVRQSGGPAVGASVAAPPTTKEAVDAVAPGALPNVALTAPVPAAPTDSAQNSSAIKVIEARLDDLSKQVGTMAEDIKTLVAGHAQSKEQLAQLTVRNTPAPVVAPVRPIPPRQFVARAAPPKAVTPVNTAGHSTNVVSIDVWNGTPSVVIAEGDGIRFMSPGDVTAQGMTVKRADPVAQQVTFGMPSGDEVTARVEAPK